MNKYNYAFNDECGPELECHSLLPNEFITHAVEDEEDLDWIDKELYSSHPTEGMIMPDLEDLNLAVMQSVIQRSTHEICLVLNSRTFSEFQDERTQRFIDVLMKTPHEFDALEVANSAIRTFTAGLQRIPA